MEDIILVSYTEPTNGDSPILIVGRKRPDQLADIINAFQGDKATELYQKLITKEEKKNEDNRTNG
jgi:hypothetical protein